MYDKLSQLYNTLCLVETKGVSTIHMGVSLAFLEGMLQEEKLKSSIADNITTKKESEDEVC